MQQHGSFSPLIGGCQAAHYDIMYNSTFMDMNDELFLSNEFVCSWGCKEKKGHFRTLLCNMMISWPQIKMGIFKTLRFTSCLFLVDQLMIAHKEWVDKTSTETQRLTGCQHVMLYMFATTEDKFSVCKNSHRHKSFSLALLPEWLSAGW